jgi:hypothetical protein
MVGSPAYLCVGISLDVVKVFLSLSHWCSPTVAPWIIIKYFSNLICKNYIKFLQILSETEKNSTLIGVYNLTPFFISSADLIKKLK